MHLLRQEKFMGFYLYAKICVISERRTVQWPPPGYQNKVCS